MPLRNPVFASPSFGARNKSDRVPQNVVRGFHTPRRPQVDLGVPYQPDPVHHEPRGCVQTGHVGAQLVPAATRGMEPAHYIWARSHWVGAVACPRPNPIVTVVDDGMSLIGPGTEGRWAAHGGTALRPVSLDAT